MPTESSSTPPRLQMKGVSKRSRLVEKPLLDQIHLTLKPSEVVMVSGRSGSGKTLLLKTIAMLEPIDEGRILWDGKSDGIDLPIATYYYIIELGESDKVFNGTVTIKR